MDKSWLYEVFSPALSRDEIKKIEDNYENLKDLELSQLGIDSVLIFHVVLNIEDITGTQFDVSNIDINIINSLTKIKVYLHEHNKAGS